MKQISIRIARSLVLLIVFLTAAAVIVVPYLVKDKALQLRLEQHLTGILQRKVTFGEDISLRLLPRPTIYTGQISIAHTNGSEGRHLLEIDHLQSSIRLLPLLRKEIVLHDIQADGVRIAIMLGCDEPGLVHCAQRVRHLINNSDSSTDINIRSDLNKILVSNASFALDDTEAGQLFQLQNLNFQLTGKTEKQVFLTFDFVDDELAQGPVRGYRGSFRLSGSLQADLPSGRIRFKTAAIEAETDLFNRERQTLPANLRLSMTADSEDGNFVVKSLAAGIGGMRIQGEMSGNFLAESRRADGNLSVEMASLSDLQRFFMPEGRSFLDGPLTSRFAFHAGPEGVKLEPFVVSVSENRLAGRLEYAVSDQPFWKLALGADTIDLAAIHPIRSSSAPASQDARPVYLELLSFLRAHNADVRFFARKVRYGKERARNIHVALFSQEGKIVSRDISAQLAEGHLYGKVAGEIREDEFHMNAETSVMSVAENSGPLLVAKGRIDGNADSYEGTVWVDAFSLNRLLAAMDSSLQGAFQGQFFDSVSAKMQVGADRQGRLEMEGAVKIENQTLHLYSSNEETLDGLRVVTVSADTIDVDRYLAAAGSGGTDGTTADLNEWIQKLPEMRIRLKASAIRTGGTTFRKGRVELATGPNRVQAAPIVLHLGKGRLEGDFKAFPGKNGVQIRSTATYQGVLGDFDSGAKLKGRWPDRKLRLLADIRSEGTRMEMLYRNLQVKLTGKMPAERKPPASPGKKVPLAGGPDLEKLDHTVVLLLEPAASSDKPKTVNLNFQLDGSGVDRAGRQRLHIAARGVLQSGGKSKGIALGKTDFTMVLDSLNPQNQTTDKLSASGFLAGDTASGRWQVDRLVLKAPQFTAEGGFDFAKSSEKGISGQGHLDIPNFNPQALWQRMGFSFYQREDPQTYQKARLQSKIQISNNGFLFSGLTLTIDETTLRGSVRVAGFYKPFIEVDLQGDTLILDRYLPDGPDDGDTTDQPADEDFFLQGNVRFKRFSVVDIEIEDLQTGISLTPRKLKCEPFTTVLAGGTAKGSYRMDFGPKHDRAYLTVDARSFRAEDVLRYLTGKTQKLTGKADVQLQMSWTTPGYEMFSKTVNGSATVVLTDGKLKKKPAVVQDSLPETAGEEAAEESAESTSGQDEWPYTRSSGRFAAQNGIVETSDIHSELKDKTTINGRGKFNMTTNNVQFRFDVNMPKFMYPVIPFDVSGYYPNVEVQVDQAAIARKTAGGVMAIPGALVQSTVEGGKQILDGSWDKVNDVGDGLRELFTW